MNETMQTLLARRSIRRYKPEQIREEELDQILQAGLYAPSGKNRQSTILVVVQNPDTLARMSAMNAAVLGKPGTDPFFGAPTCVVVLAEAGSSNAVKDGSVVLENMMIAARSLGIGSCWVNRAQEVLEKEAGLAMLQEWGLNGEYVGVGNCVLGYPDGPQPAPLPRKEGRILRV